MSAVDRENSSSTTSNRPSSDGDTKAAVVLITSEECQTHLSKVSESYLAAISRVKSYEGKILEQQNQIKSLELKLQSSQGQNLKLVQEVIKLSSSGGQGGSAGNGTISDNVHSLLVEEDTTTAVMSNVTLQETKEEPLSTSSATLAVSPQDPNMPQKKNTDVTKDQLQEQLHQLQSEMAMVLLKEKQQMCLEILEANGDMQSLLEVFATHIGGFGTSSALPLEDVYHWKHITERWIPAICHMMIQHVDLPYVQEEACRMFLNFCCHIPSGKQKRSTTTPAAVLQEGSPLLPSSSSADVSRSGSITTIDGSSTSRSSSGSLTTNTAEEESVVASSAAPTKNTSSADADTTNTNTAIHNTQRQDAIRTHRGIYGIVSGMTAHRYNPNVQFLSCWALRVICHQNATNRDVVGQERGIQAIVGAVKDHIRNSLVVSEALMTLATLCFENTQNKNAIRESDGIVTIVSCMTLPDHTDDASIQEMACLALYKCCFENPWNRTAIHDAGAIPPIVYAMKHLASNRNVQIQAMGALMNLSHQNQTNKVASREAGALEAIVTAMSNFPDTLLVQKHGCGALNNLIADNAAKARMLELRPERLLVSAGQNFPKECGTLARAILNKL